MAAILDLIADEVKQYPSLGVDGKRVGGGTFGRVTEFTLDEGEAGSRLVWLKEDYEESPLGLVVKRSRQNVVKYGYGNIHELEVSRHLCHPNVVEIVAMHFPSCESEQQLGLVMPRADSTMVDLALCHDTNQIRQVLSDVLTGLEYVHDSGYIHRDLKPNNVLLYGKRARLADFGGSARETQRSFDRMMTTYVYCAPEQVSSHYNRAVDLWSFGCILFEVICQGTPLFEINPGHPALALLTAISGCPSIEVNGSEMIDLGYRSKDVITLMWKRKSTISWKEHIEKLGYLERAVAITGSVNNLERILGGLLCTHPARRLTIDQLRFVPMFDQMRSPSLVRPRLTWTQKTSRHQLESILGSVSRIMARVYYGKAWNLCCLFTANALYMTCIKSFPANLRYDPGMVTRLYVTCIMVARGFHDIEYQRSDLIGKEVAKEEAELSNILEAYILMTCHGVMDQETAYDRNSWLSYSSQILKLYMDDFTD